MGGGGIDCLLESGHFCGRQGLGLGQFFVDGAGVAMHPVHQELIMQVGAGCRTCGAHSADDLALGDPLPLFYLALVQVQVLGDVLLTMLDEHVVAVGFAVAGLLHAAVTGGEYRCAPGCGVVSAAVGAGGLV